MISSDKIRSTLVNPTLALGNFDGFESTENAYSIIAFVDDVPFKTGDEISYVPGAGTPVIPGLEQKNYIVEVLNPLTEFVSMLREHLLKQVFQNTSMFQLLQELMILF